MNRNSAVLIKLEGMLKLGCFYGADDFEVIVDGHKLTRIGSSETSVLAIPPGRHQLFVKWLWTRSQTVDLDVAKDSDVYLRLGYTPGLLRESIFYCALNVLGLVAWVFFWASQPQPILDSTKQLLSLMVVFFGPIILTVVRQIQRCLTPGDAVSLTRLETTPSR